MDRRVRLLPEEEEEEEDEMDKEEGGGDESITVETEPCFEWDDSAEDNRSNSLSTMQETSDQFSH